MKDIIEAVKNYMHQYMTDFGRLLGQPKTFLAQSSEDSDINFQRSLVFFAISVALIVCPLWLLVYREPDANFWTFAGAIAILWLIALALLGAAVRLSWWLVGGRSEGRRYYIVSSYTLGLASILLVAAQMVALALLLFLNPKYFYEFQKRKAFFDPSQMPQAADWAPIAALSVFAVGCLILGIWGIAAWDAYRQISGLSGLRSVTAWLIATILNVGLLFGLYLLLRLFAA
jgi:hypothetical protein